MFRFQRLSHQSSVQLALVFIAVGTWLSGCGDDEEGTGGKGGSSGTAGNAGNAGSVTGGAAGSSTGGAGGSPTGGAGGSTTAGSGGTPTGGAGGASGAAGSAGSAGSGAEGGAGMGGEGGIGEGGMGATAGAGMGGEGGSGTMACATGDLSFTLEASTPMQNHDHLPVTGMTRQTFLDMINDGTPLVLTMPDDGTNTHTHTLTFTAAQLTALRNGGTIAMITSSMGGPAMNMHTHTYSIECEP